MNNHLMLYAYKTDDFRIISEMENLAMTVGLNTGTHPRVNVQHRKVECEDDTYFFRKNGNAIAQTVRGFEFETVYVFGCFPEPQLLSEIYSRCNIMHIYKHEGKF